MGSSLNFTTDVSLGKEVPIGHPDTDPKPAFGLRIWTGFALVKV